MRTWKPAPAFLEEHDEAGGDPGRHLLNQAERIPRTIAFTVLAFTQMFQVMAIHAGDQTTFWQAGFKGNQLLFWAVLSTFALQLIVVYMPFFQELFDTRALNLTHVSRQHRGRSLRPVLRGSGESGVPPLAIPRRRVCLKRGPSAV